MKVTKMFMLLQAMIWANSCSANEITDENKSTLMSRLVKKVQSRSINDTESGRSLACGCPSGCGGCSQCPGPYCCGPSGCGSGCVCPTGAPTTGAPTTGAPTGAPTGTPTQAYDFRIQGAKGRSCRLGYAVPTVEECKGAAASYGLSYKRSFYSNDRPQGCLKMGNQVYWNTITGQRSQKKVDGKAQAICISDDGDYQATFKWGMAGMGPMKDGAVVPTNRPHEVANYFRRKPLWGLNCPNSRMIQSEMNCKNACVEMGLGYKKKVNSKWRPGGCMARKSRCYFNEALVSPLTKFRNRQGICKVTV